MVEFNRKKTYKRFIYSPVTLLLLLIVFILLLKAVWGVYKKSEISSANLERAQVEFNKMESRQKELAQSVEYLKTDQGIDAEIRSKFRVVKEGESVAVIVDNEATSTSPLVATTTKSFWRNLFGF